MVTVPAVPSKVALLGPALVQGTKVAPSNQTKLVVFQGPVPPVAAAAPFGSQIRVCCALACGTAASRHASVATPRTNASQWRRGPTRRTFSLAPDNVCLRSYRHTG